MYKLNELNIYYCPTYT